MNGLGELMKLIRWGLQVGGQQFIYNPQSQSKLTSVCYDGAHNKNQQSAKYKTGQNYFILMI